VIDPISETFTCGSGFGCVEDAVYFPESIPDSRSLANQIGGVSTTVTSISSQINNALALAQQALSNATNAISIANQALSNSRSNINGGNVAEFSFGMLSIGVGMIMLARWL
jgi:hypothetical protein